MDAPGSNGKAEERVGEHDVVDREAGERDAAERILSIVGVRVDEARALLGEMTSRWRGDTVRVGEGTRRRLTDLFRELGLVTREDWEELELRIAQLEHRLRLLEDRDA